MEDSDLELPDGVHYDVPYVADVRECAFHKITYRVDCAELGPGALQPFAHCANDAEKLLVGPLLGAYEKRDGKWVPMQLTPAA